MSTQKNKNSIKAVITTLSVLLAVSVVLLAVILLYNRFGSLPQANATVNNNVITSDSASQSIENGTHSNVASPAENESDVSVSSQQNNALSDTKNDKTEMFFINSNNIDVNTRFEVGNMLPGDSVTKYFDISVLHNGNVTVKFNAEVKEDSTPLDEVLKCRVSLADDNSVLYDGLMANMPESLDTPLKTNASTKSDLCYEITAYLDTSIGNKYQNKSLSANFNWWVDEIQNLDSPHTADTTQYLLLCLVLVGMSVLIVLLILLKHRKGGCKK